MTRRRVTRKEYAATAQSAQYVRFVRETLLRVTQNVLTRKRKQRIVKSVRRLELVPALDVREEPPREDRSDGEEQKRRRDIQFLFQARHLRGVLRAPPARPARRSRG